MPDNTDLISQSHEIMAMPEYQLELRIRALDRSRYVFNRNYLQLRNLLLIEKDTEKARKLKDVKNKYFTIAKNILFIQRGIKFEDIHNNLSKELEKGQHYFQSIRENELKWIEAGIDVDSAFAETYYAKSTIEQKDVLEDVFKPTDAAHVDTTVTINQTDEKSYREESINYWVFFVIAFILVGIYVLIKYLLRKAK